MSTALVVYANGSEALEVTAITDVLLRAGVQVTTAAIASTDKVVSLHNGAKVICDATIAEVANQDFDLIAIPGGLDGSTACRDNKNLIDMLKKQKEQGKYIAAICAAPGFVLAHHGLIGNAKATGYPGCADNIINYSTAGTVIDKENKIVTGQGPAYAIDFAIAVASVLVDHDTLNSVKLGMLYQG